MTEIETPRLRLRSWLDSDFEPLVEMNADPRVMEFFPSIASRQETEDVWRRIHEHFATHGFGPWAMEVGGTFAGWLGLMRPRFETYFTPCVEIGYRLRTEFWGRGLATEGGRAVLRYGFEHLKLDEIVASPSQRIRDRAALWTKSVSFSPASSIIRSSQRVTRCVATCCIGSPATLGNSARLLTRHSARVNLDV
jgi:RimJ/RimL family protein N-acetyltransferase